MEVFSLGLNALALKAKLPMQEDFLSRELHRCCLEANHRLRKSGRGVEYILAQVTNQPLPDDEYRATRLQKRPDFACGYHDDSLPEDRYEEADCLYTIECKRLGSPSSPRWVLNRNYVDHGVNRFENPEWGYAQGCSSGMMIGFMQNMDPDVILAEVNGYLALAPAIALSAAGWALRALTILDNQSFQRRVRPSPFKLNHCWVDLRHCEFFEVPDPRKGRNKKIPRKPSKTPGKRSKKRHEADS